MHMKKALTYDLMHDPVIQHFFHLDERALELPRPVLDALLHTKKSLLVGELLAPYLTQPTSTVQFIIHHEKAQKDTVTHVKLHIQKEGDDTIQEVIQKAWRRLISYFRIQKIKTVKLDQTGAEAPTFILYTKRKTAFKRSHYYLSYSDRKNKLVDTPIIRELPTPLRTLTDMSEVFNTLAQIPYYQQHFVQDQVASIPAINAPISGALPLNAPVTSMLVHTYMRFVTESNLDDNVLMQMVLNNDLIYDKLLPLNDVESVLQAFADSTSNTHLRGLQFDENQTLYVQLEKE